MLIAFYFVIQTLSSIFNIEMVKDKTAEEIRQVMKWKWVGLLCENVCFVSQIWK